MTTRVRRDACSVVRAGVRAPLASVQAELCCASQVSPAPTTPLLPPPPPQPPLTVEQLEELFTAIDVDNSGFISTDELNEALRKADKVIKLTEAAKMVETMDTNNDSKVSLDEVKAAFARAPDKVLQPLVDVSDALLSKQEVCHTCTMAF